MKILVSLAIVGGLFLVGLLGAAPGVCESFEGTG